MINFNKAPFIYWSELSKLEYLQRRIIVASIIYYDLNDNVISDKAYDSLSKQLVEMQDNLSKQVVKKSRYYYVLYDFDGNTGFDIPYRLKPKEKEYLLKIALNVLNLNKRKAKK